MSAPLPVVYLVRHGETARYAVDVPHRIHNPGRTPAQALLVVLHAP